MSKKWIKAAGIRALKTVAQTAATTWLPDSYRMFQPWDNGSLVHQHGWWIVLTHLWQEYQKLQNNIIH